MGLLTKAIIGIIGLVVVYLFISLGYAFASLLGLIFLLIIIIIFAALGGIVGGLAAFFGLILAFWFNYAAISSQLAGMAAAGLKMPFLMAIGGC